MTLEHSMLIIAIAIVITVIAVLICLRIMMAKLNQLLLKTMELEQELFTVTKNSQSLIQQAEKTVSEIGDTFSSINTIAIAAKSMGESVEQTASVMKSVSHIVSERATQYMQSHKQTDPTGNIMQWAELTMSAWQLWLSQKAKSKGFEGSEQHES